MARMSVEERRARLVEAAITVLARDGVPHATTRAIVAEAGMQIGVFHYCFRSKEELVLEVMRAINQRSYGAVGRVLEEETEPVALVRGAVAAYWEHIKDSPLEHLLTYELTHYALRQPGQRHAAVAQYESYHQGMVALLGGLASVGGFAWRAPIDILARMTLAVIEGVTFQWLVNEDGPTAVTLLHELADYLLDQAGLADPSALDQDRLTH